MSLNLDSFPTQMINSTRRGKKELSFPTHVPTVKSLIKKLLWQNKKRAEEREQKRVKGMVSVKHEAEGEAIRLSKQKILEPEDWTSVLLGSFSFKKGPPGIIHSLLEVFSV